MTNNPEIPDDQLINTCWRQSGLPLGLLLDYDGTLTPIVNNPDEAQLSMDAQALLLALAQQPDIHLAIVSGRSVAQLKQFMPDLAQQPVVFCGLHGGQITVPDAYNTPVTAVHSDTNAYRQNLADFKHQLTRCLQDHALTGYLFEDKGASLTLHVRNMPTEQKARALTAFNQLFEASNDPVLQQTFRIQPGKDVLELLPAMFNKGSAVSWILNHWEHKTQSSVFSCYAGDDLTDEAAFETVNQQGGLSLCIGKTLNQTRAAQCLLTPQHLLTALSGLITTNKA